MRPHPPVSSKKFCSAGKPKIVFGTQAQFVCFIFRYDHIKPSSRGGSTSEETPSGSRAGRGEGRRALVLRDRGGVPAALP